jgi:hypothetical protein
VQGAHSYGKIAASSRMSSSRGLPQLVIQARLSSTPFVALYYREWRAHHRKRNFYSLGGRVLTPSQLTGWITAFGLILRSGPNCPVCQIRSTDADDRGNLSRSTLLGLLQCIERRRRVQGLLSHVGDRKLERLARAGRTCSSRPAYLGGD